MKIVKSVLIIKLIMVFYACSSQEYTTAKLAIQQSDYNKAAEWLPKAMAVEPDNPEIPVVMAVEIHSENEKCCVPSFTQFIGMHWQSIR